MTERDDITSRILKDLDPDRGYYPIDLHELSPGLQALLGEVAMTLQTVGEISKTMHGLAAEFDPIDTQAVEVLAAMIDLAIAKVDPEGRLG